MIKKQILNFKVFNKKLDSVFCAIAHFMNDLVFMNLSQKQKEIYTKIRNVIFDMSEDL